MVKKLFLCYVIFGIYTFSFGQEGEVDPPFFQTYQQIIGLFPDIHTGGQYVEKRRSLEGHPFYGTQQMGSGSVVISGFDFFEIPLQYDIWDDILLSFSPIYKQKMILNHLKISRFILTDGTVFIKKGNSDYLFHKNGFYRQIVNGDIGLYCKHRKERKQESSTIELLTSYNEVAKYFFEIEGTLEAVPNKRKLFEKLGLDKKDSKKLLRSKKLRFKKDKEEYLSTLVLLANETEENE